jgi:hypothetical protein
MATRESFIASNTILAAITAANYKENGATFEPFKLKVATASDFNEIWRSDRGYYPIVFYTFKGRADGFLPLGDIAITAHDRSVDRDGGLLFSSSKAGVLAHPVSFEYILGDSGSGNSRNILYYLPIAPDGYSALGICFSNNGAPDVKNYWCVRNDYLRDVGKADYWSDKNQHWQNSNGNLHRPVLTQDQFDDSSEEVLIVPTTFFSAEKTGQRANALVARQLYLPVAKLSTIKPSFDADSGDGASTPFGLDKVAVLPFTAIADKNFSAKPNDSPFYYLACEPFYRCIESLSTPEGGLMERSVRIGTSKTDSNSFKNTTSISVGATAGINIEGFNASITTTFTNTFEIETAHSETLTTETNEKIKLNFPKQPTTQIWQRGKRISLYRTDGSQVAAVTYKLRDVLLLPQGTAKQDGQ